MRVFYLVEIAITLQPSEYCTIQENDVVAFCEEVDTLCVEIYLRQRDNIHCGTGMQEDAQNQVSLLLVDHPESETMFFYCRLLLVRFSTCMYVAITHL